MSKLINAGLIITVLFCYLEWGANNMHAFLFQIEYEIFQTSDKAGTFTHPAVIVPLIGQLLLLITLFQKKPSRVLSTIGLIMLAALVLLVLLVGLLSLNWKIIVSTSPFLVVAFFYFRMWKREKIKQYLT